MWYDAIVVLMSVVVMGGIPITAAAQVTRSK